jgi:hypothetical protein
MAEIGTGTTITFGTSGFTGEILEITGPDGSRVSVPTSHLGTTVAHTFMPGDLVDWGEVSLEIAFDPTEDPPIDEAPESITITFPNSDTTSWEFTGFVTGFNVRTPLEERMTATMRLKITGDVDTDYTP